MSNWWDQYTSFEWLQIAIFLVGMPVAALLGSLFGLIGKWNQGRVVTAALVGLGAAAIVSVVLLLTYCSIYFQGSSQSRSFLFAFFNNYFGWRMVVLGAIATSAISFLAAIGLRGRRSENVSILAISMRQLLLLQLFAFIALGCWLGLRGVALRCGTEFERAKRKWHEREWSIVGDDIQGPTGCGRSFMTRPDMAKESEYFQEVVRIASLRSLDLHRLWSIDQFAIEELAHAQGLERLAISYADSADIDERQLNAIGAITSIRFLSLESKGKLHAHLEPLASLPKLESLGFTDCVVPPAALGQVSLSGSLRRLSLRFTINESPREKIVWPEKLEALRILQSAASPHWRLEGLREAPSFHTLQIEGQRLTSADVEAISQCAELKTLELENALEERDLSRLLSLQNLRSLVITEPGIRRSESFKENLERLAMLPSLEELRCDYQMVIEPHEGATMETFPSPDSATPAGRSEMDERKANWASRINAMREERGLEAIKITFYPMIFPFALLKDDVSAPAATEDADDSTARVK